MKNTIYIAYQFLWFLLVSAVLFGGQFLLEKQDILGLSYRIHFLLFFITFICVATLFILYLLGKKEILGFVFLGFVVFKLFSIGYIAVFQQGFKENILSYFVIYWLYLAVEVVLLVRLMKKQD